MTSNDYDKQLQNLEARLSKLEGLIKDDKTSLEMFGRSYSNVGTSNSDFLIKTRGQVKILWGNKFIDLIKDGKINIDSKFIYKADLVGLKDGIYVIGDEDNLQVILSIKGEQIKLNSQGDTYVSFLENLESTPLEKYNALINIGFLYNTIDLVNLNGILNGIVYVTSELKLYTINEGNVTLFSVKFPNPITELLLIQKNDNSIGSLVITGEGKTNSLVINDLYVYLNNGKSIILIPGKFVIKSNDDLISINNLSTLFNTDIETNRILSFGATDSMGFRLYDFGNESTLEVDNLIVRNNSNDNIKDSYPFIWEYLSNVISKCKYDADTSETLWSDEKYSDINFEIKLVYRHNYKEGQKLLVYVPYMLNNYYTQILIPLLITAVEDDFLEEEEEAVELLDTTTNTLPIIIANIIADLVDKEILSTTDILDISNGMENLRVFLVSENNLTFTLLRKGTNNIDLVNADIPEDSLNNEKIITRLGNIEELNKLVRENGNNIPVQGYGLYSNNSIFDKAQYTSNYNIPITDNSTKFASTEWVNKTSLPIGSIIMFSGLASEIPEGWAICDGTNGTPNLIGKFIKGSDVAHLTGGYEEITLSIDNLPSHTHEITGSTITTSEDGLHYHYYSLCTSGDGDTSKVAVSGTGSIRRTLEGGNHTHTVDLSNILISSVGNSSPLEINPPYYTLIYIMKIF